MVASIPLGGRTFRSGRVVERAMAQSLGASWRGEIDTALAERLRRHLPWFRIFPLAKIRGALGRVRSTA